MVKSLIYDSLDYQKVMEEFCRVSAGHMEKQRCYPGPANAEGIAWFEKMPNGVQVFYSDLEIKHDFIMFRRASLQEWYVLHFDRILNSGPMEVKLHREIVNEEPNSLSFAYLKNTMFDWHYMAPAGTRVNMLTILLPRNIVADYLEVENSAELLTRYVQLSGTKLLSEKMDPVTEEYVRDIAEKPVDDPMWKITIQNRVNLLIEHFFLRLDDKMMNWQSDKKIRIEDVERVRESEKFLIEDFTEPAPTIESLATRTAMSASKYKSLFKTIYGASVHEYFQRRRMMRAAEMLSSGSYQVKDVGYELGYTNLGSFTRAFKKEFNLNPSQLLSDQNG